MRVTLEQLSPAGCRRGAAAVELALVLPVLVILCLGCLDLGRFASTSVAVTNAARSGAGFGSVHPWTPATLSLWRDSVRQAVVDEMSGLTGFDPGQLMVAATTVTDSGGNWQAQVEVCYPFQTLVSWPGIPNRLTLRQSVFMQATRP